MARAPVNKADTRQSVLDALDVAIHRLNHPNFPMEVHGVPIADAANLRDSQPFPENPTPPTSANASSDDFEIFGVLNSRECKQKEAHESHLLLGNSGDSGNGKQSNGLPSPGVDGFRESWGHCPEQLDNEYEERAAIKEFDGGLSRSDAEKEALRESVERWSLREADSS